MLAHDSSNAQRKGQTFQHGVNATGKPGLVGPSVSRAKLLEQITPYGASESVWIWRNKRYRATLFGAISGAIVLARHFKWRDT